MPSFIKSGSRSMTTFVLCGVLLLLFLIDPDVCLKEAGRGLEISAAVLIPTLFPYTVISEMLVRADLGYYTEKIFKKSMKKLFGVSGSCAGALAMGIICGFPIGAKTAVALYSRGEISKRECEKLLSFCNFPSAPFVIFAVGKNMLGSTKLGIFIYTVNIAAGLAFAMLSRRKNESTHTLEAAKTLENQAFFRIFTDSVTSAASAVTAVCALVTFFTCAVGCLSSFELFRAFPALKAVVFSFFELTSGTSACASLSPNPLAAVLAAGAVGWSGFSVFMQIYSTFKADKEVPSLAPYIKSKLFSCAVCVAATTAAMRLVPSLIPTALPDADAFSPLTAFPSDFIYTANILFATSLFIKVIKNLTDSK